jgi:hypothetical protein
MMTRSFVPFEVRGRAVACDWLLSVEGRGSEWKGRQNENETKLGKKRINMTE